MVCRTAGMGAFNIAPEKVRKIKVNCLCLDHGKPDPTPRMKYQIKPIESYVDRPAVIELVKAFGKGGLDHAAAQAATWHLNNDISWQQLAAKTTGRRQLLGGKEPYFLPNQLRAAIQLATVAKIRAKDAPSKIAEKIDSLSLQP